MTMELDTPRTTQHLDPVIPVGVNAGFVQFVYNSITQVTGSLGVQAVVNVDPILTNRKVWAMTRSGGSGQVSINADLVGYLDKRVVYRDSLLRAFPFTSFLFCTNGPENSGLAAERGYLTDSICVGYNGTNTFTVCPILIAGLAADTFQIEVSDVVANVRDFFLAVESSK